MAQSAGRSPSRASGQSAKGTAQGSRSSMAHLPMPLHPPPEPRILYRHILAHSYRRNLRAHVLNACASPPFGWGAHPGTPRPNSCLPGFSTLGCRFPLHAPGSPAEIHSGVRSHRGLRLFPDGPGPCSIGCLCAVGRWSHGPGGSGGCERSFIGSSGASLGVSHGPSSTAPDAQWAHCAWSPGGPAGRQ